MKTILINNQLLTESQATVSIFSPILRGFGVFETMRTFADRKFFRASEHIDRLFNSAQQISLKIEYKKSEILQQLQKVAAKSDNEIQKVKIIAIPDTLIIFSEKLPTQSQEAVNTISLIQTRSLPTVKSISYLDSYISNQKALKAGCTEAILTDEEGIVYEGAYSNIFWIKNGTLYTRNDKILPGITRKAILEISHLPTKFAHIHIEQLKQADEVFLSSSLKGITSIKKIDQAKIKQTKETTKLKNLLEELIKHQH